MGVERVRQRAFTTYSYNSLMSYTAFLLLTPKTYTSYMINRPPTIENLAMPMYAYDVFSQEKCLLQ